MIIDFRQARDVQCSCGNQLFRIESGPFEPTGTIECGQCHRAYQIEDLVIPLSDQPSDV